jgi:hypothetical protein
MADPKVIFVDGLPGSGKTTLAHWLKQYFENRGPSVQFIAEYDLHHPLHWFVYHDGVDFLPPDIDHISPSTYMQDSLTKWGEFIFEQASSSDLMIIDGYPVLNSAGVFLWDDASHSDCQTYLVQVAELIEPLQPVLIYLRSSDLDAALARKLEFLQRDGHLEEFMTSMKSQPYLRRRGLSGEAGVRALWESVDWALEFFYQQDLRNHLILERDLVDADAVQEAVERYLDRFSCFN